MTMHSRRKLVGLISSLVLLAGLCVAARAQGIYEGRITGTVSSADGAVLPGATVEVSSPALMAGKRAATTSSRGTYVFLNLPAGKYKVTAAMTGFKTIVRENIEVSPDAAVTLDFTLPVGAITESVMVTAEGPIVDSKTSTIDSRIDKDLLAKLPTTRDAFYNLALTTPGMFDSASSNTLPSPTAYGSATNENVFLINGVNATNPEAGAFGTLVNVNYDAVEEVRVVALGSKAEYGSYSGAAIDVLTKSGSNDFHGTAAFYSLLGKPASNQPAPGADLGAPFLYVGQGEQLSGETKKDWEGSATVGGPIVKDKLWFFGAFDYLRSSSLPPRWPLQNESWGTYVDAKISAAPFAKHRAYISYHYENNDGNGWSWGTQPAWDTSMTYGSKTFKHSLSGQWQWFPSGTTTASAKYLGFWTNDNPYIPADAPDHPGYINWWKWADYGINGAFPYVDNLKANRQTIQADVSHYAEGFLGQHDIKFGVQYTKGRGNRQEGYFQNYVNFLYPLRSTQNIQEMKDWYGDTGLMFYNNVYRVNPTLTVRTADSLGAFFDDQWSLGKRLTINLGLRYDHMTTRYAGGVVYDFLTSPAEINGPPPVLRDRASTGNIFDFKTWSPRIGLSYKLTDDGKTVARAAYGRYYMPLSIEFLRRFGPDMPAATLTTDFYNVGPWSAVDTNGDGVIDVNETRAAARMVYGMTPISEQVRTRDTSWTLNVDPNLKDQFTDQFTVNLERELARNFSVSASYIYKHTANLFANIPINRLTGQEWEYDRVPFTTSSGQTVQLYSVAFKDYNGDGVVDGNDIQWIHDNNTSKVVNMPTFDGIKPVRDYHGLQLVFNKRYSDRWQALASFLYSNSTGMGRRSLRQDINVQAPMFWDDNWMGSLNDTINNLQGQLPFTPKYEFKLSGSYKIPKIEFDLGARLRMYTGKPMWQLESYPVHSTWADPPGGVIDPGGLGRIVAGDPNNPTILPTQALLDVHLEKAFKLGGSRTLNLIVDGFNLFNSYTPTDIDIQFEWGKVTAIPESRRFRAGVRFQF
ncbi:MAG TPA: TonB-dependent receptor [Vicinamibacteria bacterium]|nr:TonB-dependent receptor [Vicinamibacteria bacterium]